ncbi:MAG TPA: UDP-N-acetylmuramate dehydrogenase [Bacteroidia bacterium]|jgi:UDP-N-acetylmuramate dehydrogenase
MIITENHPLVKENTFGIEAYARFFIELDNVSEMKELLSTDQFRSMPQLVLGGGSNLLFTRDFSGVVLKNNIKGISLVKEDEEHAYVRAGAGENWHQFVLHCIEENYAGIENLSLIPGNIGAGPMQNIGAYGVELKDVFHELEALNMETLEIETFSNTGCRFGYRESIFKQEAKGKYIITSVTLRLNKKPKFNTSYGAIEKELEQMGVQQLSIRAISDAVIRIRKSKLPDPTVIGNAGSFFKNPVVSTGKYESLKKEFPAIVGYKNSETETKLAAGWLIEQCGWKGKREGDAGVHKDQALVLVNYGHARGNEVFELSEKILRSVKEKFGITLEREVNIV